MSRVNNIYRAAAGRYRRKTVEASGKWPNLLVNDGDKMVHIINGKAVFPQMEPIRLDTWEEMLSQERPMPPRFVEKRLVFCEDNSFWPIDIRPFSSNAQKASDCDVFYQETLQSSKATNAAEIGSSPRDKKIFAVASIVAVVGGAVIIGDLLITKLVSVFGSQAGGVVQALGG